MAFLINLAVVSTFAKQFYDETCATASTPSACFVGDSIDPSQPSYGTCDADGTGLCQEIGLSAAADALRGSLGSSAKYIWAVGLLVRGGAGESIVGRVGGEANGLVFGIGGTGAVPVSCAVCCGVSEAVGLRSFLRNVLMLWWTSGNVSQDSGSLVIRWGVLFSVQHFVCVLQTAYAQAYENKIN